MPRVARAQQGAAAQLYVGPLHPSGRTGPHRRARSLGGTVIRYVWARIGAGGSLLEWRRRSRCLADTVSTPGLSAVRSLPSDQPGFVTSCSFDVTPGPVSCAVMHTVVPFASCPPCREAASWFRIGEPSREGVPTTLRVLHICRSGHSGGRYTASHVPLSFTVTFLMDKHVDGCGCSFRAEAGPCSGRAHRQGVGLQDGDQHVSLSSLQA